MNRKINVLQVVNGFAIGGGEIKLLELVQRLNKDKYNVIVCSVGQGGPLQEEFEKSCQKVYVFPKKHRFDFSLIYKVVKLIKSENVDIVMTTLFYADVIGAFASRLAKVPLVISWDVVTQPFKTIHNFAYGLAKNYIDIVVTVSDAINRKAVKERNLHASKVKTIHYGVDLEKFKPEKDKYTRLRKEFQFQDDELLLGVVARLTHQKGHKYLVEAAPKIIARFPNVKFVFVGDGPLRENLETRISELNIESHFEFMGFRNDVADILNIFDVFVLPSLYEGLPNVVLEAMASGRPIVATAVDGTPEALDDGVAGILVPPENPDALATEIIKLLSDPKKMIDMGHQVRKRSEEYFSVTKQVNEFEELFDSYSGVILSNEKL